jgi:hypothetical protein
MGLRIVFYNLLFSQGFEDTAKEKSRRGKYAVAEGKNKTANAADGAAF